ncbi:MAG TPA: hypothetical protein H9668_04335 [Firmicutes bacterium]|nr:hypothetical protein [Bacillota bacterium]
MFKEGKIGKFLKNWAVACVVFSIIIGVVLLLVGIIALIADVSDGGNTFGYCIVFAIGYFLITFVQSIFLYAFGTLVDSSATQQRLLEKQTYLLNQIAQSTSAAPAGDSQPADDTLPPL